MIKKKENSGQPTGVCVAVGDFEGMHKGSYAILKRLLDEAKHRNSSTVVVSYEDKKTQGVLTTAAEKKYFFDKAGIDVVISCENEETKRAAFVSEVLLGELGAKVLVAAKADISWLREVTKDRAVELVPVEAQNYKGEPITTKRIHEALTKLQLDELEEMCGHSYTMTGTVVHGQAKGRTVGMPTANLSVLREKQKPPNGVYASLVHLDGRTFRGITNIGTRPSVDERSDITIETFLLDFDEDIYGKELTLEIHSFIRGIMKFQGLKEVKAQVEKDLQKVIEYYKNGECI